MADLRVCAFKYLYVYIRARNQACREHAGKSEMTHRLKLLYVKT